MVALISESGVTKKGWDLQGNSGGGLWFAALISCNVDVAEGNVSDGAEVKLFAGEPAIAFELIVEALWALSKRLLGGVEEELG